jgi:hypothetical protein
LTRSEAIAHMEELLRQPAPPRALPPRENRRRLWGRVRHRGRRSVPPLDASIAETTRTSSAPLSVMSPRTRSFEA